MKKYPMTKATIDRYVISPCYSKLERSSNSDFFTSLSATQKLERDNVIVVDSNYGL